MYPPCAAAELHMRLFANNTPDELRERMTTAQAGEIDEMYTDSVDVE